VDETLHVVVPAGIDDVARPSGGNVYDRRVCAELVAAGWTVSEHHAPGAWPDPRPADEACLDSFLGTLPARALVLVDGLIASAAPGPAIRYADRLRLAVLVHLPLGVTAPARRASEAAMLARVAAVVTTSAWTRSWLVDHYRLPADRITVAVPGTDAAELATGTPSGGELVCVGAVTPTKGHDVLVEALARIRDLSWRCVCVGALDVDSTFAGRLRDCVRATRLADRMVFTGPLTGAGLDAVYRAADALVLPSRAETYGMVVGEALARGLPVVATSAGGVPQALGHSPVGTPGVLVPPDDPAALAAALRSWLEDPDHRARLRLAAQARRPTLPTWREPAYRISRVIGGLS
jgi:glycosyltransferase involved in cell wall biosynthesis